MKWKPWILASFLHTCMQMIDGKPTRQLTYLLYEYQCPPITKCTSIQAKYAQVLLQSCRTISASHKIRLQRC